VLYRMSEHNAARLDWYTDEPSYQTNPSIRKTLFIEEIKKIEQVSPDDAEIRQKCGHVGKSVYTLYFVLHCTSVSAAGMLPVFTTRLYLY